MASAGYKNDPAVTKKLFENLQNDLRALSSEAKKKFQNVKEVNLLVTFVKATFWYFDNFILIISYKSNKRCCPLQIKSWSYSRKNISRNCLYLQCISGLAAYDVFFPICLGFREGTAKAENYIYKRWWTDDSWYVILSYLCFQFLTPVKAVLNIIKNVFSINLLHNVPSCGVVYGLYKFMVFLFVWSRHINVWYNLMLTLNKWLLRYILASLNCHERLKIALKLWKWRNIPTYLIVPGISGAPP